MEAVEESIILSIAAVLPKTAEEWCVGCRLQSAFGPFKHLCYAEFWDLAYDLKYYSMYSKAAQTSALKSFHILLYNKAKSDAQTRGDLWRLLEENELNLLCLHKGLELKERVLEASKRPRANTIEGKGITRGEMIGGL